MSVTKKLRLTCYYCKERASVDFYAMGNIDRAHKALRSHGWILGIIKEADGIVFDPLCNTCGRGVVENMIQLGGSIDPDAKETLRKVFPDLFGAN